MKNLQESIRNDINKLSENNHLNENDNEFKEKEFYLRNHIGESGEFDQEVVDYLTEARKVAQRLEKDLFEFMDWMSYFKDARQRIGYKDDIPYNAEGYFDKMEKHLGRVIESIEKNK